MIYGVAVLDAGVRAGAAGRPAAQERLDDRLACRGLHAGWDAAPAGRARWDADGAGDDLRGFVVEHLGDPDAVLVADETGFAAKPQLARRMIERAIAAGVPFGWFAADQALGITGR